MTKQYYLFQDIFKFGFAKTKQHAWFSFLTFLIISIITSAVKFSPFLNVVVGIMACLSTVSISIAISRDHHFTFQDLYMPLLSHKRVLKFILLTFLYGIAVVIGTILFIVPGVYLAVRFKFFPFVVVEHEHASIKDLITMSYKLTENHFWKLFGFLIVATLLNILGFVCFVVGLLVTVPVTIFATAHVYNKLKDHAF